MDGPGPSNGAGHILPHSSCAEGARTIKVVDARSIAVSALSRWMTPAATTKKSTTSPRLPGGRGRSVPAPKTPQEPHCGSLSLALSSLFPTHTHGTRTKTVSTPFLSVWHEARKFAFLPPTPSSCGLAAPHLRRVNSANAPKHYLWHIQPHTDRHAHAEWGVLFRELSVQPHRFAVECSKNKLHPPGGQDDGRWAPAPAYGAECCTNDDFGPGCTHDYFHSLVCRPARNRPRKKTRTYPAEERVLECFLLYVC